MPFKGFVTTLRPPRPGGDCVGQKELLINKGLRVEQGCWQVVVQSPEGCEMQIHNCHPVAILKEITPCLSVSYSLYELPTTGLEYIGNTKRADLGTKVGRLLRHPIDLKSKGRARIPSALQRIHGEAKSSGSTPRRIQNGSDQEIMSWQRLYRRRIASENKPCHSLSAQILVSGLMGLDWASSATRC